MNQFIFLAREAVKSYVKGGKVIQPPHPLPKELDRKAGVFVSIHKVAPFTQPTSSTIKERFRGTLHPQEFSDGYQATVNKEKLRGCIGTYLPTRDNVALEIIHNAIDSATHDSRFFPVTAGELPHLRYSIDILSTPEIVTKIEDLDVKRYGLIVSTPDGRRGLLLPDLEGVETVKEQISICKSKAGIYPEEEVYLERFTVERHKE
ncbi:MAG: AMMECR1 domain-containing protein [bacterium]|nr:AMMECR1 domain-containing protein [bacterium]